LATNNSLILFLFLAIKTLSWLYEFPTSLVYKRVFTGDYILLLNYLVYKLGRNSAIS